MQEHQRVPQRTHLRGLEAFGALIWLPERVLAPLASGSCYILAAFSEGFLDLVYLPYLLNNLNYPRLNGPRSLFGSSCLWVF